MRNPNLISDTVLDYDDIDNGCCDGGYCPPICLDILEWIVEKVIIPGTCVMSILIRLAGPIFVAVFYYLMGYHTWVFLTIIATVLRVRVGTTFAVTWTIIGIAITYNVVWNHMLAMLLKPGSPKDLVVSLACAPIDLTVDYFFREWRNLETS